MECLRLKLVWLEHLSPDIVRYHIPQVSRGNECKMFHDDLSMVGVLQIFVISIKGIAVFPTGALCSLSSKQLSGLATGAAA